MVGIFAKSLVGYLRAKQHGENRLNGSLLITKGRGKPPSSVVYATYSRDASDLLVAPMRVGRFGFPPSFMPYLYVLQHISENSWCIIWLYVSFMIPLKCGKEITTTH